MNFKRNFCDFFNNQGEDRWLCTLLLQQGWRVEYSAASDAFTGEKLQIKTRSEQTYLECVSWIWTSLTWLWWFGFRLEPIFATAPIAP